MRIVTSSAILLATVAALAMNDGARARSKPSKFDMHHLGMVGGPLTFLDPPLGSPQTPSLRARPSFLSGSTIVALKTGAVVIDGDSGELVRVDDDGNPIDRVAIAAGVSQLVVDEGRGRGYVVDRRHDRIVVVDIGHGLQPISRIGTPAEPYGAALTPDRSTLLVTAVADQKLVAYDVDDETQRWSMSIGPEPRGVAVSPDGRDAIVTFLTTGAVARVDLLGRDGRPAVGFTDLAVTAFEPHSSHFFESGGGETSPDAGRTFARNAFAAIFIGQGMAVVPHQVSTPHMQVHGRIEQSNSYGGGNGFQPPVAHRVAFVDLGQDGRRKLPRTAMAATSLHQPRALAYDGQSDTLYVAGYGSDDVLAIANASQPSARGSWHHTVAGTHGSCGPDGMAVANDGDVLVYCSLGHRVIRLEADPASASAPRTTAGPIIATSPLTADAQRGRELFRKGLDGRISTLGAMACTSCHPEGRTDGLSWRIEGHNLQTPLLAGRLIGSHPFKWDGKDPTLRTSLRNTVKRLGGRGISARDAKDLEAFLATIERPRTPTPIDETAVARGRRLFQSSDVACASCHQGELLTDRKRHEMSSDLARVDTPSLVGLAVSAPYYHDGSARTLRTLLMGNGSIHGMGRISRLSDGQIDDLVAYLETL